MSGNQVGRRTADGGKSKNNMSWIQVFLLLERGFGPTPEGALVLQMGGFGQWKICALPK